MDQSHVHVKIPKIFFLTNARLVVPSHVISMITTLPTLPMMKMEDAYAMLW